MAAGGSTPDIAEADFGIGRLLAISAHVFARHFRVVALIGFLVYLPIEAVMAYIAPSEVVGIKGQFEIMQVKALFEVLFGTIAAIVVIRLTKNAIDREPTAFGPVWRAAKGRYFSAVAATIAMNLVVLGLAFLLVIPGLLGYVYTTFYLQVVTLREETGFHALRQSKAVIEGRFWRVTGYVVLFTVLYQGMALVGSVVETPWLAVSLATLGDIANLYLMIAGTVLYLHLERTRFL